MLSPTAALAYTSGNTIDLNPAGYSRSVGFVSLGSRQMGEANNSGTTFKEASVWTGYSGSISNNNGVYTQGYALGGTWSQYVGAGLNASTGSTDNALLWNVAADGTLGAAVNLNPAGWSGSYANATTGTQQAGYGWGASTTFNSHALLWTGTSSGYVDLHSYLPVGGGYTQSYATTTNGTNQAGYTYVPGSGNKFTNRAMLWSGSSATAVDLHPGTAFTGTYVNALAGNQQFGYGWYTTGDVHAMVWSGTAASYQDINPTGYASSRFIGANTTINGLQEVGYGVLSSGGAERATLWNGLSTTAVDLHALLPGSPVQSGAMSIDVYGNISGWANYGTLFTSNPNREKAPGNHAVVWLAGSTYKAVGGTGTWNTATNWLSGAVPTSGQDVQFLQSDGTNRTVSFASASPLSISRLVVDAVATGTMTVSQAQDTLNSANEFIGYVGHGSFSQSGGTHAVSGTLKLGAQAGATGSYGLSGTGALSAGAITINSTSSFTQTGGSVTTNSILNAGTLTLAGTANIGTLDAVTSGTTSAALTAAGTTIVAANATVTASRIRQMSLILQGDVSNATGTVTLNETSPGISTGTPAGDDTMVNIVRSLSIDHAGDSYFSKLDLKNNDIIIDYTGSSNPLAAIEAMVKSGYNGGNWLGKGITSSIAAGDIGSYALVVLDNASRPTPFGSFDGVTVPTTVVIVKFSWVADLDLDGVVTSNDAIVFANNYSEGASATHRVGDLNYNGIFDSNDAILFANAYNETLPHLPEPASLGMLAIGAVSLLLKRRR